MENEGKELKNVIDPERHTTTYIYHISIIDKLTRTDD